MPITHAKVSGEANPGDPGIIGGEDWDDAHDVDHIDLPEATAPATPATGNVRIYAKADGRVYSKDDAGTEYGPFDAAGGGPLLAYEEGLAIGANGDEFEDMSGWTATGSVSSADTGGHAYDASVLTLTFPGVAVSHRYTKSAPTGDFTAYLSLYGSPASNMLGWNFVNSSGNGVGLHWRGGIWWWDNVSGWGYASQKATYGYQPPGWPNTVSPYLGGVCVLRFRRVGTTVYAAISLDGDYFYEFASTATAPTGTLLWMIGNSYDTGTWRLNVGRLTVVE